MHESAQLNLTNLHSCLISLFELFFSPFIFRVIALNILFYCIEKCETMLMVDKNTLISNLEIFDLQFKI